MRFLLLRKHPIGRVGLVADTGHTLQNAIDLTAITVFIVVPEVKHRLIAIDYGGFCIKDTGGPRTDKIAGDDFWRIGIINLLFHFRMECCLSHIFIKRFPGRLLGKRQVKDCHGDIGCGNPDSITG